MNGLLFANGFNSIAINKAKTDVADDIVRFHTRAFDEEVERVVVSSFCGYKQVRGGLRPRLDQGLSPRLIRPWPACVF